MAFHFLTVGNPNSGKTTLFNGLTGTKQRVGNWAGVTVEKKTGQFEQQNTSYSLTDLPGIYALDSANDVNSIDESIASSAVAKMPTDLIINVVDATNLERNLYLTLQLRELGRPMVVVLNKMDALSREQKSIDAKALEQALGCPVFMLSATNKEQMSTFKEQLHALAQSDGQQIGDCQNIGDCQKINRSAPFILNYPADIEQSLTALQPFCTDEVIFSRGQAMRLIEGDTHALSSLDKEQAQEVAQICEKLNASIDVDLTLTTTRYDYLYQLCQQVRSEPQKAQRTMTERVDSVLLNQWLGLPIFLFVMYLMFMFSINIGSAFIDFFDIGVGALLVDGGHALLDGILPVWLVTVLADGIGGGIQTVATFIPVIACLYLFLSLLESSGYIARAAFVLDKLMQMIGLPGKAFIPLILGFGCNVPAIMATRTLDQERERKLAASMAPFMSCGARLPVYTLFVAAFFSSNGQNVVFALYLLGIVAAVLTGLMLKHTLYPGKSSSFIMEMPDYEIPTLSNVILKTWHKLKRFVFGAGKTIVCVVAVLSFFNSLGTDGSFGNEDSNNSVLSKAAQVVTPVFEPMGIQENNWQATVGIITGIFAKEAVVGTLNSLYAEPEAEDEVFDLGASLMEAVQSIPNNLAELNYTDPLGLSVGEVQDIHQAAEEQEVAESTFGNIQANFINAGAAFAYLLFILLYTPCAAAMGAYMREFGRDFSLFIAGWTAFLGYACATIFYQASTFAAHPVSSSFWIGCMLVIWVAIFMTLKHIGRKQQSMRIDVVTIS